MKVRYIFAIFFLLTTNTIYSQNIDTTYVIDSLWRNDTLYIIKTAHIKIIIHDSIEKKENKKTIEPKENEIIRYPFFNHSDISQYKKKHSIDFSPVFGFGYFKSVNYNFLYLDTTTTPLLYGKFGIDVSYTKNYFSIISGIENTCLLEYFYFSHSWIDIKSSKKTKFTFKKFWKIDTIWFLDVDSLLAGDTVYVPYYDSTLQTIVDSQKITKYDTTKHTAEWNTINCLASISLPLIFKYNLDLNVNKIGFAAGVITNAYLLKKYKIANPDINSYIPVYYTKLIFSAYLGFEYKLFRKNQNFMDIDFYTQIPLQPELTIGGYSKKFVKFGIDLKFKLDL